MMVLFNAIMDVILINGFYLKNNYQIKFVILKLWKLILMDVMIHLVYAQRKDKIEMVQIRMAGLLDFLEKFKIINILDQYIIILISHSMKIGRKKI